MGQVTIIYYTERYFFHQSLMIYRENDPGTVKCISLIFFFSSLRVPPLLAATPSSPIEISPRFTASGRAVPVLVELEPSLRSGETRGLN